MKPMLVKSVVSVVNNLNDDSKLVFFTLHENPHLLEDCCQLIYSTWPSSKKQEFVFQFNFNICIKLNVNDKMRK